MSLTARAFGKWPDWFEPKPEDLASAAVFGSWVSELPTAASQSTLPRGTIHRDGCLVTDAIESKSAS
jgi:hypothetical protein